MNKILSIFVALLFVFAFTSMASAQATVVNDVERYEQSGSINGAAACSNSEVIYYSGTFMIMSQGVIGPDGELQHITSMLHFVASGVGEKSGENYSINESLHSSVNPGFETSQQVHVSIHRQGKGGDIVAHGVLHVSVDANGVVRAYVDNVQQECS